MPAHTRFLLALPYILAIGHNVRGKKDKIFYETLGQTQMYAVSARIVEQVYKIESGDQSYIMRTVFTVTERIRCTSAKLLCMSPYSSHRHL